MEKDKKQVFDLDDWLDLQEAAGFLKLKPSWVYQLVFKRKLPHYQKGRKLYFLRSELNAWLLSGRKKTVAELETEAEKRLER